MRKIITLASLGSAFEYFDFVIFGMLMVYLGPLFFPASTAGLQQLQTFLTFAAGYLARPIGALLFSLLGDFLGRKKAFLIIMLVMAISTLGMGLLPTYADIGFMAPIALLGLRILQGLSFGAELPGAITVIAEFSPPKNRSRNCSFTISATAFGSLLGSFIMFIIIATLNKEQMLAWGWRLPLLGSALFAAISYYIRRHLPESPCFKAAKQSFFQPLRILLKSHFFAFLSGTGAMLFPAALVVSNLFFPAFLLTNYQLPLPQVYLAMTCGMIWSVLSLPLCGLLADRFGPRRLFLAATLVFCTIGAPLLIYCLPSHLILFMLLYQTFISGAMSGYLSLLPTYFKAGARFTGIALCYSLAYAAAAIFPSFFMHLHFLFIGLSLLALLSCGAAFLQKEKQGAALLE